MPADWPPEKPDQARKAREAAEALFRPKPVLPADARATPVSGQATAGSHEPQPVRQPRILVAPPDTARRSPPPVASVPPAKPPRPRIAAPRARKVPASEHQRILTLITYGMTQDQVAALYEVPVDAIQRIVAAAQ